MENVYSWLFILSGSTITALGSFLIVSGRELRRQRREFDRFKRNQTAQSVSPSVVGQPAEAHLPVDLIAKNKELLEEISSLTNRLEESQSMLGDREKEQRRLLGTQAENQQMREENDRLGSQLETSQRQLGESFREIQETAEASAALQAEIEKLHQQLAERETAIETLQEALQKAAAMQSENQRLQEQTAYTERRAIVERHAQLQTRFAELMQQTEEATAKNTQLLKEVDALQRTLAASEENAMELRANARLNNQQLIETNDLLQREIEEVRQQLATAQSQLGASAMSENEAEKWNQRLQNEIDELKQELKQRQATVIELQNAERRCGEFQTETQQLRLGNQNLQIELDGHRIQLSASESRSLELAGRNQELADHCARLEIELADSKEQLEANHREIKAARERLANAESREERYRDQQRKLETQIIDLERELSREKEKIRDLDNIKKRLGEMERVCQEMGEENRRLADERARWPERFAANEDDQRQVSLLGKQLEVVRSERARVIEGKYKPTERVVAAQIEDSFRLTSDLDRAEAKQDGTNTSGASLPDALGADRTDAVSSSSETELIVTEEQDTRRRVGALVRRNWRFGALPAAILVAIVVAMGFLGIPFSTSDESAVAPETSSDEFSADDVARPQTKATHLPGTYETVRTTEVYTGPSEKAALVGNIGPKIKLNVVGSRNGWLEIRSKHGRPPGFIRQETAVKIGQN